MQIIIFFLRYIYIDCNHTIILIIHLSCLRRRYVLAYGIGLFDVLGDISFVDSVLHRITFLMFRQPYFLNVED